MKNSKIAILGLAGLQTMSQNREPLAIIGTLKKRGAVVTLYLGDNFARNANDDFGEVPIEKTVSRAVLGANCALVALEEVAWPELDPEKLASQMSRPAAICDVARALEASNVERAGLFYTSIGRGRPGA